MFGTFPKLGFFIFFYFSGLAQSDHLPRYLCHNLLSAVQLYVRMICRFVSSQFSFALSLYGVRDKPPAILPPKARRKNKKHVIPVKPDRSTGSTDDGSVWQFVFVYGTVGGLDEMI